MKDEALIKQLKLPTHITYISQYITKQDMQTTIKQLERLVEENLIKEVSFEGYYVEIKQ
jgi:DNA-binding SARP family transcriptional activator